MRQDVKEESPRVRKLCVNCMGMVRFARNKNDLKVDICDYCRQNTKVKAESLESEDIKIRSLKPVPYPLLLGQDEVGLGKFCKTWRGIAVFCAIVTIAYLSFF